MSGYLFVTHCTLWGCCRIRPGLVVCSMLHCLCVLFCRLVQLFNYVVSLYMILVYVCVYIYIYTHTHICICVCIYIYIYVYK